jgi:hypothetical protein
MHQKFDKVLKYSHIMDTLMKNAQTLAEEDGVSEYSKLYWNVYDREPSRFNFINACHETLAEIAAYRESAMAPESAPISRRPQKEGSEGPAWKLAESWNDVYKSVVSLYDKMKDQ